MFNNAPRPFVHSVSRGEAALVSISDAMEAMRDTHASPDVSRYGGDARGYDGRQKREGGTTGDDEANVTMSKGARGE